LPLLTYMDLIETDSKDLAAVVAKWMQELVTTWEVLLSATGGALVPEKCFWYMIGFEFQGFKWKYLSPSASMHLSVQNANGQMVMIPQLPVTEAQRTLGVRVAPDGNNKAELEHQMTTASNWFTAMKAGQITLEVATF